MSKSTLVIVDPATPLPPGTPEHAGRLRLADPDQPQVLVSDLGVTRGDGIFETFGVVGGDIQAMEPHLRRLLNSAVLLDLPELDLEALERAVRLAVAEHPDDELLVKLIVTRGVEGTGRPTAWAYGFIGEDYSPRRLDGIAVVTLDRGYRHDIAQTSPWLLQGAKTLSYAVNKAVLREAARRGAEDVIFLSTDGYVLEGPSSTVIIRTGDTFVTPRTDQGILEGTTQHALFGIVTDLGYTADYRYLRSEELTSADGLWLVSSGQQIAPIISLDGQQIPHDPELTQTLLKRLQSRDS
ncbi:aminodeoxychorismate lyase [Microlunatus soli]|uniref:4-amino-4-deoxychorismate lyase n=1 Tax=Microlunatus soli TaxID=630515 RepID=A0A1H1TQF9_9ACTN|nr:aminodeoxychorismate lyase [Microlunatus soli]SDS62468.1 4-amino-4-deoxychorismate lyase [Microlunatus soli]